MYTNKMWKNLESFLSADATLELDGSGQLSKDENLIAVLALMLRVGYQDGELSSLEIERAVEVVMHEFQRADIRHYVEVADFLAREKSDSFIQALNENLSEPQKVEVLKILWKVISADNAAHKEEASFAASVRKLLNLSLEQAFFASRS